MAHNCQHRVDLNNTLKRVKGLVIVILLKATDLHLPYGITHPTQVNAPRALTTHAGTWFTYPGGWLLYRDGLPVRRQSSILVATNW